MRYMLGRCMMAMERLGTHREMGLSSSIHFATQHLKINERLAKTILSVTKQLEELPILAQAVLHAEIEWSQIREVVSVATPETEELWKKLCIELNCKQIQILVAATPKGGVPGEIASKLPRKTSEYRCRFQPEVVVLIERGLQKMSRKLNKPIMFREAVERFFTEFLADKPYDEAAEKMLEEARKDFLAGRIQQEPLVLKAREVARDLGLLEGTKEPNPCENYELIECLEQAEFPGRVGVANQPGVPGEKNLSAGISSEKSLSEDGLFQAEALEAVENLQQAIGGDVDWEALQSGQQPSSVLSHVGGTRSTSSTPHLSECENSFTLAQQNCLETFAKQPLSNVAPLRTPLHSRPDQVRFELQAPSLLNELLAHLKFNPDSRFPTKAQRKALLRRDRYCCRTPGCTNHLFLEIHHIKRYSQGGKTLPQFLLTLCSRCHKNTEEGKLFIRLTDSGQLAFTDQNGKNLEDTYRLERAIWLDYWLGWKGTETDSHWARAVGFSDSAA